VFERASRNLHALIRGALFELPRTRRTVSPFIHPRSASGGATNFLPASALLLPNDLAIDRQRRRAMRRTDVCHPIQITCTRTSLVPGSARPLRSVDTPRSLWLRAVNFRGTRRFTTSVTASAGRRTTHVLCTFRVSASMRQRGRFLPTEPCATEPLTPLSRSFCRLPPPSSSRGLHLGRASLHVTRVGAGR
jgi:hypothetical protein